VRAQPQPLQETAAPVRAASIKSKGNAMEWLIWIGAAMSTAILPINIGSLLLSILGLMLVVVGIFLG